MALSRLLLVALVALCVAQVALAQTKPGVLSTVSCANTGATQLRRGLAVICTISPRDATGKALAASFADFDITLAAQGRVVRITSGSATALKFAYISGLQATTSVLTERIQVSPKGTVSNVQGSPINLSFLGTPSELSVLDCDRNVLLAGESTTCTITLRDQDGLTTSGLGASDFTVSTSTIAAVPGIVARGQQQNAYSWTYTAPAEGVLNLDKVSASLNLNGLSIQGSPQYMVVYNRPSDKSTLHCDESKLTAGDSTVCTVTVLDSKGQPTVAKPSDFEVSSDAGVTIVVPDDGVRRSVVSFVYAPAFNVRRDTIRVKIGGREIANRAVTQVITPASVLSTLKCEGSILRPSATFECTVTPIDAEGLTTFVSASVFSVSTASGAALDLSPASGLASEFTFTYTAPEVGATDEIQVSLAATGESITNSPWNVRVLRDRITSVEGNNVLAENQGLVSANGKFRAALLPDGNAAIYRMDKAEEQIVWVSGTAAADWALVDYTFTATLSADGSLSLSNGSEEVWNSGTSRPHVKLASLIMQDNGDLALYVLPGNTKVWSTGTAQKKHE